VHLASQIGVPDLVVKMGGVCLGVPFGVFIKMSGPDVPGGAKRVNPSRVRIWTHFRGFRTPQNGQNQGGVKIGVFGVFGVFHDFRVFEVFGQCWSFYENLF